MYQNIGTQLKNMFSNTEKNLISFAFFSKLCYLCSNNSSLRTMKMKNGKLTSLLTVGLTASLLMASCIKQEEDIFPGDVMERAEEESIAQAFGDSIVLGERLNNPYSVQNMQAAYNQVRSTRGAMDDFTLQPNLLYVRFLPKDSADVAFLQECGLELFDYPLDYDIVVMGNSYHDPSLPDTAFTWQYTCVKPDFIFPDMTYEVIEECFVPDDETSNTRAAFDWDEVEETAMQNAGLPDKYLSTGTSTTRAAAKVQPKGKFQVYDESKKLYPIEGVKVRCNHLVNISTTYTKADGTYVIPKSFSHNPNYSLIYESTKGFVIWGNLSVLAPADQRFGSQDKSGLSKNIKTTDDGWKWAVINVAACDYYRECIADGIKLPPDNLKIMSLGFLKASSAPMLRRLKGLSVASGLATALLAGEGISGSIAIELQSAFLIARPDITIGTKEGLTFDQIYYATYHELNHASHFAQTGEAVWGPYINYIVTSWASGKGCYGDGTATSKGKDICELGETWAYANERVFSESKYRSTASGYSQWFYPSIYALQSIMTSCPSIPRKYYYSLLDSKQTDICSFFEKIKAKYSSFDTEISTAMAYAGCLPDQTQWVIHNSCPYKIYVNLYSSWLDFYHYIEPGESLRIAALPSSYGKDFSKILSTGHIIPQMYIYEYNETTGSIVRTITSGNITSASCRKSGRYLSNAANWTKSTTTKNGKSITTWTFDIQPTD